MSRQQLWNGRLDQVARARSVDRSGDLVTAVAQVLDLTTRAGVWTALYAMAAAVPRDVVVTETLRRVELEGPGALLDVLSAATTTDGAVEVVSDATLVDVAGALEQGSTRLVAEVLARWRVHDPLAVRWRPDGAGLVRADADPADSAPLLVPLGGRYLGLGEDLTWEAQAPLLSLVHSSGLETAFVGYGCGPVTSVESYEEEVSSAFANRLAALRHADRLVAVSQSAAQELAGWRRMLGGAGLTGPEISVVRLPGEPTAAVLPSAVPSDRPTVLVVGQDKPDRNHDVVRAAVDRLATEGIAVELRIVLSADRAALEAARLVIHPALHDDLALPVAEALAVGTPVVAASFGATAEAADGGGAVLVDPRDDDAVTDAMRRLLTDGALLAELEAQARARPRRTWDNYAEEAWAALTGDQPSSAETTAS